MTFPHLLWTCSKTSPDLFHAHDLIRSSYTLIRSSYDQLMITTLYGRHMIWPKWKILTRAWTGVIGASQKTLHILPSWASNQVSILRICSEKKWLHNNDITLYFWSTKSDPCSSYVHSLISILFLWLPLCNAMLQWDLIVPYKQYMPSNL